MSSTSAPDAGDQLLSDTLSKTIEWIISLLMVVGGAIVALVGYALTLGADRDEIRDWIASGRLHSDSLTDAELAELTFALMWWGGVGLVVVGLGLLLAGVLFVGFRTRVRRRTPAAERSDSAFTLAVVGAVVTVVTSFVPFSPVLGGGVAGYLRNEDAIAGLRTGVLAGLVGAIPAGTLLGFVAWAVTAAGFEIIGAIVGVAIVLPLVYFVGLSAVGGYLGGMLAERNRETDTA